MYAQIRVRRNVIAPAQVGPGEFTEHPSGETVGFHPNAVYLNGTGQELDEADGTGAWWVKHSWVLDGEGYYNWELTATDYTLGGNYTEGTMLDDDLTMKMSLVFTEDVFTGIPVDPEEIASEHYGNLRIPILDADPVLYEVIGFEPANYDPEAGPIDLTSTETFSLIMACREEPSAFDGLARSWPQLMD
ncbi:MAG: hypothetical protein U9R72_12125 [Chloroflexota bacterium]|nr:hypothetical protein [Chloroflexota bacterium]